MSNTHERPSSRYHPRLRSRFPVYSNLRQIKSARRNFPERARPLFLLIFSNDQRRFVDIPACVQFHAKGFQATRAGDDSPGTVEGRFLVGAFGSNAGRLSKEVVNFPLGFEGLDAGE